jgi:lysyl-tRNA synthetase class II
MKKVKIILIILVIGIVSGLSTVYYVFNKPHRDVEGEKPTYTLKASELYKEFNNNEKTAYEKFGDKVIQVSGKIIEISKEGYAVSIILNDEMEGINCALDSTAVVENKDFINNLKSGDQITLKGKCDGFDMIMGVVLTRCFIIK